MYGTDLCLVLLCTLSFRADPSHSVNSACEQVHAFDVKHLQDQRAAEHLGQKLLTYILLLL